MLTQAIHSLKSGKFVIIYDSDSRESEADLAIHASFATPGIIEKLRKDAGGLICFATSKEILHKSRLEYLSNIFRNSGNPQLKALSAGKTPYGDDPAFSISVNHKKTFTGITDNDRSKTIVELAKYIENNGDLARELAQNFYAPGHVPLLFSRDLDVRKGHTELAVELCRQSSLAPAIVICEILGEGSAMNVEDVKRFAIKNNIPFINGEEIIKASKKQE